MYYTIYKTTNLINGKYYIGKHQTKNLDDGYIGSGKRLKYAIRKYGPESFVTDILFVYDQEWKMNLAERILVVPDVETNYNLCPGGKGGFGYLNSSEDKPEWVKRGRQKADENGAQEKAQLKLKELRKDVEWSKSRSINFSASLKESGKSCDPYWVTNGIKNKKIKSSNIPDGFWIGKTEKFQETKKYFCVECNEEVVSRRKYCIICGVIHRREILKKKPLEQKLLGRKYYTNGIKDILIYENQSIPDGFYKGRSKGLRVKK